MQTPLWQALSAHAASAPQSFHTPGHKSGRLVPQALRAAWGEAVFRYDLTEVPGLDNLAHPEGALAASMAAWAEARGCAHVQYLLGGTSLGLKAAMLGLCRGRKVFVPRHAHTSIYQGMVLAGAEPVTLDVTLDDALGIPLGVAPETLARAIAAHPDCRHLVLVHPTYHGITWENAALIRLARENGLTVIADSAHGAHFTTDLTPPSALALGADVVIESAHKTLPCLTQASVMLIREAALVGPLTEAVRLLHTTSPSYLLMASLEAAGAWLDAEGPRVMAEGVARIHALTRAAAGFAHLRLVSKAEWRQDPFKLYLSCAHASGETIAAKLAALGGTAEMSDGSGCLLMPGLDGGPADIGAMLAALDDALSGVEEPLPRPCYAKAPPRDVALAEAWFAPRQMCALDAAAGRTAAAVLEPYPPGIPLLLPGERVTPAIVEAWRASGRDPRSTPLEVLC